MKIKIEELLVFAIALSGFGAMACASINEESGDGDVLIASLLSAIAIVIIMKTIAECIITYKEEKNK